MYVAKDGVALMDTVAFLMDVYSPLASTQSR
jgi:hypothetical protein